MISCWAHRLTNKLSENTKKKEGKKEKKKEGRMGERERGKRRLSGGMLVLNYNLHQLPSHSTGIQLGYTRCYWGKSFTQLPIGVMDPLLRALREHSGPNLCDLFPGDSGRWCELNKCVILVQATTLAPSMSLTY